MSQGDSGSSLDSLHLVFPHEILPALEPKASWGPDHPLRRRYQVLTATGPYPTA